MRTGHEDLEADRIACDFFEAVTLTGARLHVHGADLGDGPGAPA